MTEEQLNKACDVLNRAKDLEYVLGRVDQKGKGIIAPTINEDLRRYLSLSDWQTLKKMAEEIADKTLVMLKAEYNKAKEEFENLKI